MTKPIGYRGYKLNPVKLAGASQSILPYVCGAFYYTEDFEYFNIIKPYLDIPKQPKSLEEISQELDEKFEKLIEKTHLEYRIGHKWLYKKKRYEEFCKKQDADFEYAKEHGQFPEKLKWVMSNNTLSVNNNVTSTYVIKQGNNHEGYYTFGTGFVRFYMTTKPNFLIRFCADKLLGFKWIDDK